MAKYTVGDKVLIVNDVEQCSYGNIKMNKWANEVMTIREFDEFFNVATYKMQEDINDFNGNATPGRNWHEDMIAGLAIQLDISNKDLMEVLYG